jgi:hypothetical protein
VAFFVCGRASAIRVRAKINSQIVGVQAPAQQGAKTKAYPASAVFSRAPLSGMDGRLQCNVIFVRALSPLPMN